MPPYTRIFCCFSIVLLIYAIRPFPQTVAGISGGVVDKSVTDRECLNTFNLFLFLLQEHFHKAAEPEAFVSSLTAQKEGAWSYPTGISQVSGMYCSCWTDIGGASQSLLRPPFHKLIASKSRQETPERRFQYPVLMFCWLKAISSIIYSLLGVVLEVVIRCEDYVLIGGSVWRFDEGADS